MENKLKASVRIVFALAALLAILAGGLGAGRAAGLVGGQTLTGRLEITYGDGQSGQTQELYSLVMADGSRTPLFFGETLPVSSEELTALRGELVTVSGGGQDGGMTVTRIGTLNGEAATPDAVLGSKPWVSLLCKFADVTTQPKTPAYFQDMYRSSYPGMDHHWREQSFDLMNVLGSAATTQWYVLPQPRSYYVYNNAFDFTRATNDCTAVANAEIYFPNFVGINMMFNADLDGFAWGGSRYLTLDGVSKTFYTTWEPPWGYTDITVIAHEMGHGFGLPHSSGMYGQTYDNQWDVMSDTWSNCSRLRDATYGCLGQHTISYHKDREGWIGSEATTVNPFTQQTVTLEQLSQTPTTGQLMVKIPISGSSIYYTVEARRNTGTGYDVKLPGSAVIIHQVDPSRSRPANVVDIDLNGNTGDSGAQWVVGEVFNDATNKITVTVNSATTTGFEVTVCNACNEPPPTATTAPTATPQPTATPLPVPMHVGDLDRASTASGSKWTARVTITVHDANHNPVSGVLVTGAWSAGAKGSASCTTASDGTCPVTKTNLSSRTASVTFTITSLTRSGYVYTLPNHDPDGDSNGTVIVVPKP